MPLALVFFLSAPLLGIQTPPLAGPWTGAIEVAGTTFPMTVVFADGATGPTATIDIQGATGLALRAVKQDGAKVHFELPAGMGLAVFDGAISGASIAGTFTQGAAAGSFHLIRGAAAPAAPVAPVPYRQENVTFTSGSVSLAGTVTIPAGPGPFPAIVMITGSGAQDRNEELFGFKPFQVIADHLARHGIAALRYDDRGVGGSTGSIADATTADFAGDALAGVALLSTRPEIDKARIGLFGHSEGGAVAAIAASRSASVAFIVSMAGTSLRGGVVLRQQAGDMARANGASDEQVARILAAHAALLDAIHTGAGPDDLKTVLRTLSRAQIEALPAAQRAAVGDSDAYIDRTIGATVTSMQSRWMRFFVDFDPAEALAQVKCPVLALFGGKDTQVPAAANRTALEGAMTRGGNARLIVKVYPEANHLFVKAGTGQVSEYATLEKIFVAGLLDDVTSWILVR